jgi:hypothetical protein
MWRELWWKMAGGIKSEYDKIKGTDVQEFWKLFDLWHDQIQKERELYKQKNSQNAGRK